MQSLVFEVYTSLSLQKLGNFHYKDIGVSLKKEIFFWQ